MKTPLLSAPFRCFALVFLLLCLAVTALAASSKAKAPDKDKEKARGNVPANSANSLPEFSPAEIPHSVFVIPATPREGRNPFFPQSASRPQVSAGPKQRVAESSRLVLNGITSPPKRTAMINGRTFEVGESGEIKTAGGAKILITCEEIRNDSAIIVLNGERRELRLRLGL